jgi:hypothetical protein
MENTLETLVAALNAATTPFELAGDMPLFQQGMTDLLSRLQALEKSRRPTAQPAK